MGPNALFLRRVALSSFSSRCGHKRILSHSACALGGVSHTMRKGNSSLVHALLALRSRLARYHPEKHYMRGPGPKWHAKHDHSHAEPQAVPALVRVKG